MNRKRSESVFLVALFALISACATDPIATSSAIPVPVSRIIDQRWTSTRPDGTSVIVKRDSGYMGVACTVRLFIDGLPIADLETSEKVELFLTSGERILGVRPKGFCGGGVSEALAVITQGRPQVYRVAYTQAGDLQIQPTAF